MRTFDTNVVVRILLGDDPQQAALAAQQWREALQTGEIFLPACCFGGGRVGVGSLCLAVNVSCPSFNA